MEQFNNNRIFAEARAKMQESINKHTEEIEESSEEDEIENEPILNKVLQRYEAGTTQDFEKTFQSLTESIKAGSTICLICIRSVKRNHIIWSCKECCSIFHLPCIQKWAKDSTFNQSSNEQCLYWSCPKCRYEYPVNQRPSRYVCFCGKVENPKPDAWTLPHSCGDACRKPLKPLCGHSCLLLCHPGRCPPCPQVIQNGCYCGKAKPQPKRCSDKYWSCNNTCGKLLGCKQHKCEEICHSGECKPCRYQSYQNCDCGSERKLRPCDQPMWKCEKVCKKNLSCGNHDCEEVCHSGECSPCPLTGLRTCPCGKTSQKLPCTKQIEPCGDTCDKPLDCQLHTCSRMCHYGDCSLCFNTRLKRCRCGLTEKNFVCSKVLTCNIKCRKMKDCGRHSCSRKCCDGNCLPCDKTCGKTLQCGNHKCQSICHPGPCFPCNETIDLFCACQKTKLTVPCGRKKTAQPPTCKRPCDKPSLCHHPTVKPHSCHFGPCPPCKKPCGKPHEGCGHDCKAVCHSAKVIVNPDGPPSRKKKRPQYTIISEDCPPCKVPISVSCLGNHEVRNFECYRVEQEWICSRLCKLQLACQNHVCEMECHSVDKYACLPCDKPCLRPRPANCNHHCQLPCHPGPCPPCKHIVKFRCHCQLMFLYLPCHQYTVANNTSELFTCKNKCPKELECGHRCPTPCHPGSCPDKSICQKKIAKRCPCGRRKQDTRCNAPTKVNCDEECHAQQEERRMAKEKERKLEEEAQMKLQQEELEKYQRKQGGKRRNRKQQAKPSEETKRFNIPLFVGLPLLFLLSAIILYYSMLP